MKDAKACAGCRDDFYNQVGNSSEGKCWQRDKAKIVTRFRTGVWTLPLTPGAFTEVRVPSCYRRSSVVFVDAPHPEAVDVVKLRRRS